MPEGMPDPKRVSFTEFIRDPATLENADPKDIVAARDFLMKMYPPGTPTTTSTSSTTTTTMPKGSIKDRKYAKELADIQAELDSLRKNPSAPTGAFVDSGSPNEMPMPEALPPGKSTAQSIMEEAVPTTASMLGGSAAARAALPVAEAIPHPLGKAAVLGGAAILGAGAAGAGGSLTMEGAKYALGLPGAPDSIDDAMGIALSRGGQEMTGELWGQGIGAVTSRLAPYRRSVTPESFELMKDQARRLRSAYEAIGGKPLVEEVRAMYNPMRYLRPIETELDDSAVVQRLLDKGLDPKAAREVALTGGLTPSTVSNSVFSRLQGIVSGSKVSPEMRQAATNRAKATLAQTAILEDVGLKFADTMPVEDMGKAVNAAIRGRFNVLQGARQAGMNAITDDLPALHLIDVSRLKARTSAGPGAELLHGLPDKAKFTDIAQVRSNIVSMANDLHLSPEQRYDASQLAVALDKQTVRGLPPNLRSEFQLWAQADNDINFEQFNTAFMKGMLKQPKVARKYAEEIIRLGDSDSYKALERAMANTDDGEKIFANVKAAIGDRFMEKAKVGDIIQPQKLRLNIDTEARGYGRAFLNRTLGPEYVKNAERFATVSETINEAMRKSGIVAGGLAAIGTMGGAAESLRALYQGRMEPSDLLPVAAAMFAPKAVSAMLGSKTASKFLLKAAENVAKGYNPKTTGRLAGRALAAVGLTPELVLEGTGLVPEERLQEEQTQVRSLRGDPYASLGGAT